MNNAGLKAILCILFPNLSCYSIYPINSVWWEMVMAHHAKGEEEQLVCFESLLLNFDAHFWIMNCPTVSHKCWVPAYAHTNTSSVHILASLNNVSYGGTHGALLITYSPQESCLKHTASAWTIKLFENCPSYYMNTLCAVEYLQGQLKCYCLVLMCCLVGYTG